MAADKHYPVIIVGGGPTGLTLANLLGVQGLACLLIERNRTTVQEPRAVSIDDESLRTIQSLGLIDTVIPDIVPGYGSRYMTASGRCFLTVEPTGRPFGYPRRNAFRQPLLEARLRDGLQRHAGVVPLFGSQVVCFQQTTDKVTVTLERDGIRHEVSCDYLIGADGGRSTIRKALGISMQGRTQPEKWLIVDLVESPVTERATVVFCDAHRPCIALPGPGETRRFEFKQLPGETDAEMLDPQFVQRLLASHGAHANSRIARTLVYNFHALIAQRWSEGRVFLAGDAAHLTPPFAGQGMNSGIRDAHNLAWKLAEVLRGRVGQRLLDTYERERRPHVAAMIDLALRMGKIMGPSSVASGWLTQSALTVAGIWPPLRAYFAEMKYKPKPRFNEGFLMRRIAPLVGRLLPQPVVEGMPPLDRSLGEGFALIGIGVEAKALAELANREPIRGLAARPVVLPGAFASTGAFPAAPTILLVRPDRYVMAVAGTSEYETFAARLQRLLDEQDR